MPTVAPSSLPAAITWTNETRKLSDLIPWERNPRQIRKDQAARLVESFQDFGQVEQIAIGPDNEVYNGHQRLSVLKHQYGPTFEVEVRVSSRPLSEKEREKLTIFLHLGATGDMDFNSLANWNSADLISWGMDAGALKQKKLEITALNTLLKFEEDDNPANYTRKIKAPIYQPQVDKPALETLTDTTRAEQLLQAIETSDLPEGEKNFLRLAAMRHTVFNYHRIADYYAHSSPALQQLMEDSALVIIDFDRAIELGFVSLSEEITRQYSEDYGEAA